MRGTPPLRTPVQIVAELFSCIDGRNWDGLSECFEDRVVYERPGYEPLIGKRAVLDFYLHTRVVACGRHRVEGVIKEGDYIACWGSFSGTAKDGRALDIRFADIYRTEGGRISLRRTYFDSPAI